MGYELFAYAIVVALMAIYVYNNERRMGEIFFKLDQTALANIEQKHKFELLEIEIRNSLTISNLQKQIHDIIELAQPKQQKLDSLNEKMVDIEKKNEMKLQDTENRNNLTISYLQKQINDMTVLGVKTPNVVFKARDVTSDSNLIGKLLVFPNMIVNHGGGYNPHTGVFTAPVSGVYFFSVQLCPEAGASIHMHIKVKATGDVIGDLNFNTQISGGCVSANGVDVLSQGDQAWIHCTSASSSGDVIGVALAGNSFSGVLIHI